MKFDDTDTAPRGGLSQRVMSLVIIVVVAGTSYLAYAHGDQFSGLSIARQIAQPWFVWSYVGFLILVTLFCIARSEQRLMREGKEAGRAVDIVRSAESPDTRLRVLNRFADARINTKAVCLEDMPSTEERQAARKSAVRGAVGAFMSLAAATVPRRHVLEGLRPAATMLRSEIRRRLPRIAHQSDFVVRLSLLGTFIGIIAALTIASANVGIGQGDGAAEAERMQNFLQQLLATAAAKFWISAIGLALALVLRLWQSRADGQTDNLAETLGRAFDDELNKPDVSRSWCPASESGLDPISQQLYTIADQIKKSADKWVLTIEIGADGAQRAPAVRLAARE